MNNLLDKATFLPRQQQKPNTNNNSNSNDELREKLHRLRQKRKQIHDARQSIQIQHITINKKLSDIKSKRQIVVEAYQSVLQQRSHISNFLFVSERWNVINDCFHIWHQGPFATILNARLGLQAPNFQYNLDSNKYLDSGSELSTSQQTHHQQQQQSAATQPPPRRSYFLWPSLAATAPVNDSSTPSMTSSSFSSSPNIGNTAITANNTTNVSPKSSTGFSAAAITTTGSNANNSMIVVPWPEINTAIGHCVLLLIILQEKVGFTFTHTLVAQSSTSKIMIQKKTAYNLYFDDADVGVFMGRGYLMRNFHLALQALLQCVSEASRQLVDKTIVLPHVITRGSSDDTAAATTNTTGEWKIGGLSINPDTTTAAAAAAASDQSSQSQQQFTRACKYLLTDMKWLVAYTVKHHVDR